MSKDKTFRLVTLWSLTVLSVSMAFFFGYTITGGITAANSIGIYIIGADFLLALMPFMFAFVWATWD